MNIHTHTPTCKCTRTLIQYTRMHTYIRTYTHMVGHGSEIWEIQSMNIYRNMYRSIWKHTHTYKIYLISTQRLVTDQPVVIKYCIVGPLFLKLD